MYADFDTVSFSAMSNSSQVPAPEKGSEPVQCESPSKPTSESFRGRGIPAQGEKLDNSGVETGDHGGGASRAYGADKDGGLQEEVAESSGAGEDESLVEAVDGRDVDRRGDDGSEDDGGYHTPTSPTSRIPADLPCPPAPRKIPPKRPWQKRKLGDQKICRVVRRCIELGGEFELVPSPVVDDPPAPGQADNGAGEDDVVG